MNRIPPHSEDAEQAVLSAILIDHKALNQVIEVLEPEAFYNERHRTIYETMRDMSENSITIDLLSLQEELRNRNVLDVVGGIEYLTDLSMTSASSANIDNYSRVVLEHSLKRQLIKVTSKITDDCFDLSTDALEQIDIAEGAIFDIAGKRLTRSFQPLSKLAKQAMEMIVALSEKDPDEHSIGVPTGYNQLDDMLGGFQNSDLVILAARPSMGKTAFALSLARNVCLDAGVPVAVFSIEMAAIQLVVRLLSAEAKINAHDIRTGRLKDDMLPRIAQNIGILSEAPLYIDDSASLTVMELRAKCRRLKVEHNIGLIVVDYLQLLSGPKAESREREISVISRSLKQIAKELDVPVIALSQLNRSVESRSDKRPMLSDLRESGSIEQDADVVMFIHRPEHYDITTFDDGTPTAGVAEIIIGKQRNGPVGSVKLHFVKNYARFENLEFQNEAPPEFEQDGGFNEPVF